MQTNQVPTNQIKEGQYLLMREPDGIERAVRFIRWSEVVDVFIGEVISSSPCRIRKNYSVQNLLKKFQAPQNVSDKDFLNWLLSK